MNTKNEENVGWREEVEGELKEVLKKFLPLSEQGGWGIKYIHPVTETYENGTVKYDENKCVGAMMYIQFEFEDTYNMEEVDK
jgi:hypothetical protein